MKQETYALATAEDFPTHRLRIVKGKQTTENGRTEEILEFRYFTEKEAKVIVANINSRDQFITLGTEAFPKFNCCLEKMTGAEIKAMNKPYFDKIEKQRLAREEAEKIAQDEELDEWIKENSERFETILRACKDHVDAENKSPKVDKDGKIVTHEDGTPIMVESGFFWGMSEKARNGIYKSRARLIVRKKHFPSHNA